VEMENIVSGGGRWRRRVDEHGGMKRARPRQGEREGDVVRARGFSRELCALNTRLASFCC
jgi:hypothetical protein